MDEYVVQQKIQKACFEPRAPEGLIQQVILRAQAVSSGVAAQRQLETAPAENVAGLVACVLIGQLAAVTQLPRESRPEQLARQLERQPAFLAALRGGNVAQRLSNGELLQQLTGQKPAAAQAALENTPPIKAGPEML